MIIEQFNKTGFHAHMQFVYRDGKTYIGTGVDFEEQLIELQMHPDIEDGHPTWVRCENVELVTDLK